MPPRNVGAQPAVARVCQESLIPALQPLWLNWFLWYSRRYVRKHFHALRMSRQSFVPNAAPDVPLVLFCNHASWWDPLIAAVLKPHLLPQRRVFAPIEETMLERYRMFRRLGFFGVQPGTARGAVQFLKTAQAILAQPATALWLTPQGRFADAREQPPRLQRGLSHLAQRVPHACYLPVAIEYCFWNERLPEVLIGVGAPVGGEPTWTAEQWHQRFKAALASTQALLATDAVARDAGRFETMLAGRQGVNFFYDGWRRVRAGLQGRRFNLEHGAR